MPRSSAKPSPAIKPGNFIEDTPQADLFLCEIANWPVKDDIASMEFPLFSLAKQKDTQSREYRRGNKVVRIIPSSVGAATVFDKDLLLYVASQIVEARNKGLPVSRTVQITSMDFLLGTERGDGRTSFEAIIAMLRRLRGTTIETNIPTGKDKVLQTKGFSMIDTFEVLSSKKRVVGKHEVSANGEEVERERVFSFTVTISEWLYNGLIGFEVLTLDRKYFKLTRSIDRRLYEIARKHCGDQAIWKINIDLLAQKIGTTQPRSRVRDELRKSIAADEMPDYRMAIDTSPTPDDIVFYTRESGRLSADLVRTNRASWYQSLERFDNAASWMSARLKEGAAGQT